MDRRLIYSRLAAAMALLLLAAIPAWAEGAPKAGGESAAEIGAKLSDPTSDVWALFTQFGMTFSDGDANAGDPKVAGNITFQPIMPIPIYGSGEDEWRLIVRPTLPVILGAKIPNDLSEPVTPGFFSKASGLGDMFLPMPLSMPTSMLSVGPGAFIVALGPTFLFPSATKKALGSEQYGVGASAVFGYKTKKVVAGVFPQYFWRVGDRGDRTPTPGHNTDLNQMDLLYFAFINLPNAWQVGMNPTITYNHRAKKGNQWNVPIGLDVTKTIKIGKMPIKFQFGAEYSVVSQDDYGQRFQLKLNIIPVVRDWVSKPIFGGG